MINRVIDISHWNQPINWEKVKAAGIDGVYIKCTGYNFQDPMCLDHATKAKAQGIAVGYYHFADPNQDATAQALAFKNRLYQLPKSDLMPVLDVEVDTMANVKEWIQLFIQTLGSDMMLYSYQPYLEAHNISFDFPPPLWLAQYGPTMTIPKGWGSVALWQFTNASVIDGMPNPCDEDKPLNQSFVYIPDSE